MAGGHAVFSFHMKLAIGVPLPQTVSGSFLQNIISLITYTSKLDFIEELHYIDKGGVRTDKNRNVILQNALERGCTHIFWIDADMLFPHDAVEKLYKAEKDIIGCLYYKRTEPYDPVGYVAGTNPIKPFRSLRADRLPQDEVVEVDGLGFGGMLVSMDVYKNMGDDKWMVYDKNFHLPFEIEGQLTHDLVFCRKAQEYGYKIHLHTGVKPGHIAEKVVTEDDWFRENRERLYGQKKVVVIMPTIHQEQAEKTAKILETRAGYPFTMVVVEDRDKSGFVATCNAVVHDIGADYYAYVTDDIFPSRNWLLDAMNALSETGGKLFGFNDGKFKGALATCGLVEKEWMRGNYGGDMFYSNYFGHYNDTELTLLAMNERVYTYDPDVSLIEVDYEKEQKKVHKGDRELFNQRKEAGFDGRIADPVLRQYFG